jgi:hypothetical protein
MSCQVIQKEETTLTEQLLAAAGFQMKMADTPERMAHLQTLAQRQVMPHDQNGQTRYVYADAKGCKCLYVGDESQYDEYEKLLEQQRVADQEQQAATLGMMDWGLWE